MPIILTCSCGQHIGQLRKPYLELIQKYSKEDDPNGTTPEYRAIQELAEKHGFDAENVCCRQTLLCTYDATDLIS